MADETKTYTGDQIAVAARDLRDAAGAPTEAFSLEQVISMLSDEIRLLRERGFSNERIANLFTGFDIDATADDIAHYYGKDPRLGE